MIRLNLDTDFLIDLIDRKGLPDRTQAKQIGISRSSFISYKKGEAIPKVETINDIAAYYKVSPWALLKEVEE